MLLFLKVNFSNKVLLLFFCIFLSFFFFKLKHSGCKILFKFIGE